MNRISPNIRAGQFKIAAGELHVWIADLDARSENDSRTRHQDHLSAEERERAARFMNRRDGERWAHSHTLLRSLLGSYLGTDPAELRFQLREHGKPRLRGEGERLRFSVSHSGAIGLYAVAIDVEVGVDVERPRPDLDVLAVTGRAFGEAEAVRLERLEQDEREGEFLRMWVRHEARLKCLGVGLGAQASQCGQRATWTMDIEVRAAAAALVATRAPARVKCWEWKAEHQGLARTRPFVYPLSAA